MHRIMERPHEFVVVRVNPVEADIHIRLLVRLDRELVACGGRGPEAASTSPGRAEIPPLAGLFLPDDSRGELNLAQVAELPEFLGRPRVLEDHLVDLERVDLTCLKAFDRWLDATDELAELLLVISGDGLASGPTIGSGGHIPRVDGPGRGRT
ncbi:hypothetical protein [Nocardioides endophyticus]|uniref:hypothetical protein n=1 Tax=Nocardioides endophyticus TaxID=1353775 RepID=UPI0031E5C54F